MEITTKLALYVNDREGAHDLIQHDGTCSSSCYLADDFQSALMRYTKNNVKLADELTTHFLVGVDTCLLAFFLVSPYHDQEHLDIQDTTVHADGDLRISNTELLLMLFRQVMLKMTRFDGGQFSAFSLSFQFTPIRFCNPKAIVNENQLELLGPFGCNFAIEDRNGLTEHFDDIIVEVPTWHVQAIFLAVAMGTHERIGKDSPLLHVPAEVLSLIERLTVELF